MKNSVKAINGTVMHVVDPVENYVVRSKDILIAESGYGYRVFWDGADWRTTIDRDMYGPGLNTKDASYLAFYDRNMQCLMWVITAWVERNSALWEFGRIADYPGLRYECFLSHDDVTAVENGKTPIEAMCKAFVSILDGFNE